MSRLTRNAAKCVKCNTVIESRYRHDFVSCPCGNFVDGGLDYCRSGGKLDDLEDLCEFTDETLPELPKPRVSHLGMLLALQGFEEGKNEHSRNDK